MTSEEIEGAISLLAQRLHNVETALVKLIEINGGTKLVDNQTTRLMSDFFECSESLGAFEREGWFAAEDKE